MTFKAFRNLEVEGFKYYQLPKELYTLRRYANLSNNACVLYSMLRDRLSLSIKNNWTDEEGNVYFIFTRKNAAEMIRVSESTVKKVYKELKDTFLLKEVEVKKGLPTRLYLGKIIGDRINIEDMKENEKVKVNASEGHNIYLSPRQNITPNNTNRNKTEINNSISKDILSSFTVNLVIDKWNSLGLSKIIAVKTGTIRYKLLKSRISEYGIDNLLKAIENINNSNFLKGQNNKGWTITFDWLIKPSNFIKVLEDTYKDNMKEVAKNDCIRTSNKQSERKLNFSKLNEL